MRGARGGLSQAVVTYARVSVHMSVSGVHV